MQMKHVLNAAEMKQQNEKKVLDQIRIRPIPRIEIARNIGLTRAAVSVLANQLIDQGILMEGQAVERIAEITGMPAGTVKSHLSRGKNKLATFLKQNGYE